MVDVVLENPKALAKPLGPYSHIARVRASEFIFIAGQLATDADGNVVGDGNFEAQVKQTFENIAKALQAVGAAFTNVVQFTTYLVHSQDISHFRRIREELFPELFPTGKYPPNTLLVVDRLVNEKFLIEIQTVAAI